MSAEQILSCIINISINGADLILDRVFDNVEFNRIDDEVFRQLIKARLSYPASKAATVEYLKNHFYDVTTLYFESDYENELRKRASPEPSDYIGTVGQHWRLSACVLHS